MGKGTSRGSKVRNKERLRSNSAHVRQPSPSCAAEVTENRGQGAAEDDDDLYDSAKVVNLPAYDTKHLDRLNYNVPELRRTLSLHQSSTTHSTSSSLWLASQVLAAYLLHTPRYARQSHRNEVAVELGARVGFLSVILAHMGWDVVATDLPEVLGGVIRQNIAANLVSAAPEGRRGRVRRRQLDWLQWTGAEEEKQRLISSGPGTAWADEEEIEEEDEQRPGIKEQSKANRGYPHIGLIIATDTLYVPHLVEPFWRTFSSLVATPPSSRHITMGFT